MLKRGFFSASYKEKYGSCWWTAPDGKLVEVTEVVQPTGQPSAEPDLIDLGEVKEWHHGHMYCGTRRRGMR